MSESGADHDHRHYALIDILYQHTSLSLSLSLWREFQRASDCNYLNQIIGHERKNDYCRIVDKGSAKDRIFMGNSSKVTDKKTSS